MDILAALASDPTALLLWAVLAFAAGMYPVGMMFSCRTCCRCSACTVGELPQTVTVTFDNFVDEEEVQGPDLIAISATACFGSGFSAKVTAPGGYPDFLSLSGGSGVGMRLAVSVVSNGGDPETFSIDGVSIESGGYGYTSDDLLTVNVAAGGVTFSGASVRVSSVNAIGSITGVTVDAAGTYHNSNAALNPSDAGPITAVEITSGGGGYAVLGRVEPTITIGGGSGTGADLEVTLAEDTSRCAPSMLALSGGSGTGMDLSVSVASNGDSPETFGIQGVIVLVVGSDYEVDDVFEVDIGSGDVEVVPAVVRVTAVDGSGGIVSVAIDDAGGYYKSGAGIPSWTIDGVTIASGGDGGTGYVDGEQLTATVSAPGSEAAAAALSCRTTLSEPTLTPAVGGGSDAAFTVTLTEATSWTGRPYWYISAITVDDGGSGYTDGAEMTFTLGPNGVESSAAYAVVMTSRSTPTLVELFGGTGTSAVLGVSIASNGGSPETWGISSVTITDGGAGYLEGDVFSVNIGAGDVEVYGASVSVTAVDGAGAITGVSIDYGGDYYHDDGIIESVDLYDGGAYWDDDGVIAEVVVDNGGSYYEEDASEPPYVSDVDLLITQTAPSAGTGAVLSATVDDDTSSPTFGQITAVAIDTAGDDYLAWEWLTNYLGCCGNYYNGKTVVARRGLDGDACQFVHYFCGVGSMYAGHGRVIVSYNGPEANPSVALSSEWVEEENQSVSCNTSYQADAPVADCDAFEFVATSNSGETASVVPGGDYDQGEANPDYATDGFPSCSICCRGTSQAPREITVSVVDNRPGGDLTGNYVLEAELVSPYSSAGITTAGYVRWAYYGEPDEFGNQPGVLVQLWLDSVAGQTRTSYIAGDDCFRCYVGAGAGGYGIFPGDYEYAGPICAPTGSYDLRQSAAGNSFVGLTITVL